MSETNLLFTFSIIIIVGVIASRYAENRNFPRTIPLIVSGMLLVVINTIIQEPFLEITDIHEVTLFVSELALIAILFKEGMHFDLVETRKYFGTILLIATVGIVIKTFIIGLIAISVFTIISTIFSTASAGTLSLSIALLIGAIFTPTDPAATFAILRSGNTRVKEKIEIILGGESAFNDVFAIILVSGIFIPLAESDLLGDSANLLVLDIVVLIIWQFAGGAILGLIIGYFFLKFIKRLRTSFEETFISLSAVALLFGIGYFINTSAAIGALVAGIVFANPTKFNQAEYFKREIFNFWDGVTWVFELIAFILLGVLFSLLTLNIETVIFALFMSVIVVIGRFLGIFTVTLPLEAFHETEEHFNTNERMFVSFAGMKGLTTGILALLAFTALDFNIAIAEIILNSAIMVLVVTGLVQGLFLKKVGRKTKVLVEVNEMEELVTSRIVTIAKLEYLVKEYEGRKLTSTQYKALSIPLKEKLMAITERSLVLREEQESRIKLLNHLLNQNESAYQSLEEALEKKEISIDSYKRAIKNLEEEKGNLYILKTEFS